MQAKCVLRPYGYTGYRERPRIEAGLPLKPIIARHD